MKFNKKIVGLMLVLVLLLSLVSCSSEKPEANTSMEVTTEAAAETTPETTPEATEETPANPVEVAVNKYFAEMPEHIYKISQVEFVEKVANKDDMFIIDMRSAEDYGKNHIMGAVNINFNSMMSDNLQNIPQDKEVFIYCYSGQTAGQAVATLNIAGINARSVNLGFNFGISKVEGVDAVLTTDVTALAALGNDIDPAIQEAADMYYAGLADKKGTVYANYKVSEDNLKKMIDENDDSIYILSVRQQDAYDAGHIKGAELLPFGNDMYKEFGNLPMDKTIVVYCYSGQTAGQTVSALRLLGYDAVSLNGGMGVGSNAPLGWSNKGFMVESPVTLAVDKYFAEMPEHIYKISQVEFVEKVANEDDMFIIDMRSAEDYGKNHIKGAVNINFNTMMSDNLQNIPQDKEVFIYCYSGQTAGQSVATLNIAGINARSVNLGFNFGISKVEGVDAVLTTDVTELVALGNDIDPMIQAAADVYYAGLADKKGTIYANYKVSEDNLKKMIDENDESIYILSARQEDAYDAGHIAGAELLPFGNDMYKEFGNLPMDKTIVVYCYSGQTAGQTVSALRLLGFDAVSLNGGMGVGANAPLGWSNKGYEVVQ